MSGGTVVSRRSKADALHLVDVIKDRVVIVAILGFGALSLAVAGHLTTTGTSGTHASGSSSGGSSGTEQSSSSSSYFSQQSGGSTFGSSSSTSSGAVSGSSVS